MKKVIVMVAICLSLLACGQSEEKPQVKEKAPPQTQGQEAVLWVNKGMAEFQKGELDSAIVNFQKAIELDPKSSVAYNMLGESYRAKQIQTKAPELKQKAITSFQKAVELNPQNWSALVNLGTAYYEAGDKAKAAPLLKKALALNPGHPWKARLEAMIADAEGKAQAQPTQSKAPQTASLPAAPPKAPAPPVDLHKSSELMKEEAFNPLVKGYDLFRDGKNEAAQEQFLQALQADPGNPFARNNLAALMERQGKLREALTFNFQALNFAPLYHDKLEQACFAGGLTAAVKPLRELDDVSAIAPVVRDNRDKLAQKIRQEAPKPLPPPSSSQAPQN